MCNTIVQLYFKYVYDVTSVTMATTECLEKTLQFPVFANYLQNQVGDLPFLLSLLIAPNIRNFLERYKKNLFRETMAMSKKAKTEIQKIPIYKFPRKFFIKEGTPSAVDKEGRKGFWLYARAACSRHSKLHASNDFLMKVKRAQLTGNKNAAQNCENPK